MQELGLNELKKVMVLPVIVFVFTVFIFILAMSSFGASSSEELTSVKGLLTTEEGQRLYEEVWKKPIQEVYEETHISVHIAWVIVPSCMIDDPFMISHDRAKEIVMLAMDSEGEEYVETSLVSFVERLISQPEFSELDKEKIIEIIEANEESADITTIGNIPEELGEYMKLNLSLPVKKGSWSGIGDVGMYNPFGEWRMHYGMDIAVPTGTPLYAAADATVEVVYHSETGGNTIMMRNGTLIIIYCHMRELSFLKTGDTVKAGDLVGYSGATGRVTGPHLHFETWSSDVADVREGYSYKDSIFFNPRLLWNFD